MYVCVYVCLNKLLPHKILVTITEKVDVGGNDLFCKIWPKLMIFQILVKIDNFSNIGQNNGVVNFDQN